ncbi:hypothetical protein MTO96_022604 [Rhipicephalus appendiculatus]
MAQGAPLPAILSCCGSQSRPLAFKADRESIRAKRSRRRASGERVPPRCAVQVTSANSTRLLRCWFWVVETRSGFVLFAELLLATGQRGLTSQPLLYPLVESWIR